MNGYTRQPRFCHPSVLPLRLSVQLLICPAILAVPGHQTTIFLCIPPFLLNWSDSYIPGLTANTKTLTDLGARHLGLGSMQAR